MLRDLEQFELATRPTSFAMLQRVRADLHLDRVEAWDIDYWLHRQETAGGADPWPKEPGLERLRELMRAIGFAVDSLPIDIRIWDVPTGGITFPVRPPYEARLLSNPFSGSDFYSTLFHDWLERTAGVTPAEAARLEHVARMRQLLWLRRTIALNAYAEITQYLNRTVELDSLYAASEREGVTFETARTRLISVVANTQTKRPAELALLSPG